MYYALSNSFSMSSDAKKSEVAVNEQHTGSLTIISSQPRTLVI